LDGAHNAAAAERLAATLGEHFAGRPGALILGVLRDKNYDQMCRILAPLAARISCVPVTSERTCDPAQLADLCRAANPQAVVRVLPNVVDAFAELKTERDLVIVITGSLFLVGEALERLGFRPPATHPRELVLQ
jgi:dihydrofolate synthase/folylpolyglutamate synthase